MKDAMTVNINESDEDPTLRKAAIEILIRAASGGFIGYILGTQLNDDTIVNGMILLAAMLVVMVLHLKIRAFNKAARLIAVPFAGATVILGFMLSSPFI